METANEIGYSFGFEGRNYGQKVQVAKPTTKATRQAYLEATVALFINAIDSYQNLYDTNKPARKRATRSKSPSSNKRKSK